MRFIIAAYDFPPIPSPQSLRWAYLARELAGLGHDVHVIAPDVAGYGAGGLPTLDGVAVHRVYPGPIAKLAEIMQKRVRVATYAHAATWPCEPPGTSSSGAFQPTESLNWKGRLRAAVETALRGMAARAHIVVPTRYTALRAVQAAASTLMYPDWRAEWAPWARARLRSLARELKPDAVITSHEPANALDLGWYAKTKLECRWVADLGDPVLASYTPERWRPRAHALERRVCHEADAVIVTAEAAARLLSVRHGLPASRFTVITQGFAPTLAEETVPAGTRLLELLYTGSFYAFRRPDALVAAVLGAPGTRLWIASIAPPPSLVDAARLHPERIRLMGFLPHVQARAVQRRADVLVNLANQDPAQVPGKLYEYLGSGRPILHIGSSAADACSSLIRAKSAGWAVDSDAETLTALFRQLVAEKQHLGRLKQSGANAHDVDEYAWRSLAGRVAKVAKWT